jgi:hypothetical protein
MWMDDECCPTKRVCKINDWKQRKIKNPTILKEGVNFASLSWNFTVSVMY